MKFDRIPNFSYKTQNPFTIQKDAKKYDNQKYRVFSNDYFYNLQMLFSQVFNSNNKNEQYDHLLQTIGFLSNTKLTKRHNEKLFIITSKLKLDNLISEMTDSIALIKSLANIKTYPNLTTDERIGVELAYQRSVSVYEKAVPIFMRIINFILTTTPKVNYNELFGWNEGSME